MTVAEREQLQTGQMVSVGTPDGATTIDFEWHQMPTPDLMEVFRVALAQELPSDRQVSREEFDRLMDWFYADDSLDWDAVERARIEGWS